MAEEQPKLIEKTGKELSDDSKPLVKRGEHVHLLPGSILNPKGITGERPDFLKDANEGIQEIEKINNISVAEAKKRFILKA